MLQGRPEVLQYLNDYLLGIGYKTMYENDFENFMHKTEYNRVGWFYYSCTFYIEFTSQGKFLITMDCLIKTDNLGKAYDTPKDSMINYTKKTLEIPFEDANLNGIKEILCSNVKSIKEYVVEKMKQELEKDFI